MDVIYRRQRASCAEVLEGLADPPGYSAVRAMMNKLVDKGFLGYEAEGKKYIYYPLVSVEKATESAVRRLVRTFFEGSVSGAIVALLDEEGSQMDTKQLRELEKLLKEKRLQRERGKS